MVLKTHELVMVSQQKQRNQNRSVYSFVTRNLCYFDFNLLSTLHRDVFPWGKKKISQLIQGNKSFWGVCVGG